MYVIGRRGHGRETYPQSPRAGGGATSTPLSRQRFIDGDTTVPGLGAASAPFPTIAAFIASRGNVSVADATANYVGWLMPALNGYTENVHFPPYASTELRADSFSADLGTVVTGNVTWANVAGAHPAAVAVVDMHNVTVTGVFTVTDDGGAPSSVVLFGGDEVGLQSELLGGFDASGATHLTSVFFENALVNNIAAGIANADVFNSECNGQIAAGALVAANSSIDVSAINVGTGTANFSNCQFVAGSTPALAASGGATFDGPSWQSFWEAGGARAVGTTVLVVGGYSGAAVEGAGLQTAADTSVSLNGTGATAGFTGEHSGNHYSLTNPGGDRIVTLLTGGGELPGDTMLITKTDLVAHSLTVKNNASTVIGVIPSGSRGFVLARLSGGDWVFSEGGSLAA